MPNKKLLSLAFIFALSSQINAQTAETAEPPAPPEPVQEAPEVVQPEPVAPPAEATSAAPPAEATPAAPPKEKEEEKEEDFKRHEIKLDVVHALFDELKIGYEYWLDNRNALGLTALRNFSTKPDIQIQALASYKLYMLKLKKGPWFFVSGDVGYTRGYNEVYYYVSNYNREFLKYESYNSFTVGLAGGLKFFIPKTNIGFETAFGINRLYGRGEEEDDDYYYDYEGNREWLVQGSLNLVRRF